MDGGVFIFAYIMWAIAFARGLLGVLGCISTYGVPDSVKQFTDRELASHFASAVVFSAIGCLVWLACKAYVQQLQ